MCYLCIVCSILYWERYSFLFSLRISCLPLSHVSYSVFPFSLSLCFLICITHLISVAVSCKCICNFLLEERQLYFEVMFDSFRVS
jgi:hypothetical protein